MQNNQNDAFNTQNNFGAQQPQQPQQGYPQQQYPQMGYGMPQQGYPQPAAPANGLAIGGMICGIASIVASIFSATIIVGILGVVLGAVAIVLSVLAKKKGNQGGMATAGIACGIVGAALCLIFTIICGAAVCAVTEAYNEITSYGSSSYYDWY